MNNEAFYALTKGIEKDGIEECSFVFPKSFDVDAFYNTLTKLLKSKQLLGFSANNGRLKFIAKGLTASQRQNITNVLTKHDISTDWFVFYENLTD